MKHSRLYFFAGIFPAFLASFLSAQSNTFPSSGNVGIGTTTPGKKLMVVETLANPGTTETLNVEQQYAITSTDTDYNKGLDVEKYWYDVPSGVTANGYQIGIASQVFVSDSNFLGTISNQYAIWARTGINVAGASGPRTIGNAYGIYLEGLTGAGTVTNHYGVFQVGSGTKNFFGGDVGIGTTNPGAKLQVSGSGITAIVKGHAGALNVQGSSSSGQIKLERISTSSGAGYLGADANSALQVQDGSLNIRMVVLQGGNVGIGTNSPSHKLEVNGTIRTKEVIVESTGWPDYVFADDYPLPSLSAIERHVREHKHLPDLPSAARVAETGVSLGEMQTVMLRKIEELTLYVIELKKENTALRLEMEAVKQKVNH